MPVKVKSRKKGLGAQVSAALENDKNKKKGKKEKPVKEKKESLVKFKGEVFPAIPEAEKEAMAVAEDAELREIGVQAKKMSVRMMVILNNSKVYGLWKLLKDKNGKQKFKDTPARVDANGRKHPARSGWENWLCDAMPQARSTGFALIKQAEALLPVIPKAELEEIPARNRNLLLKVPPSKFSKADDPIRVAARGTEKELRTAIQNHAPEAHIDSQSTIKLDSPAKDICDEAIQAAMILNDCKTEGEALETICVEYLQQLCNDERFQGMTNQRAAEALRKQRESEPAEVA